MTKDSQVKLLRLSRDLFLPKSPSSKALIEFFTHVINTGYDYNKKYGVIDSPRIKDASMFLEDLGLYKAESFLLMLVKNGDIQEDALIGLLKDVEISIEDMDQNFRPNDLRFEDVLGTIGGKQDTISEGQGWELTGVVSFQKGVGSYLIGAIADLARKQGKDHLFCSVIYEHGLSEYYKKFGFVEYGEKLLQKIDETGKVVGGDLEDDVYALRNFHVAFLRKGL
jgi:hypothetical protein